MVSVSLGQVGACASPNLATRRRSNTRRRRLVRQQGWRTRNDRAGGEYEGDVNDYGDDYDDDGDAYVRARVSVVTMATRTKTSGHRTGMRGRERVGVARRMRATHGDDAMAEKNLRTPPAKSIMLDFCITFPWSALVGTLGVAAYASKRSMPSLISGLTIACVLALSGLASLVAWRSGRSSTPWTASSALTTLALTAVMVKKFAATGSVYPSGLLATCGSAVLVFYLKNIFVDGGNAPKTTSLQKP